METKVTGSGPVASNRKRGQGSSWTVDPAEEEEEEEEDTNFKELFSCMSFNYVALLQRNNFNGQRNKFTAVEMVEFQSEHAGSLSVLLK
jgi:hypothetical protein